MDGYIYVCDGAYLRAVNTLFTISIGLSKLEDSVIKYLNWEIFAGIVLKACTTV